MLFDDIWEHPGLPKRDRSLITVTTLVVLYRTDQLGFHLRSDCLASEELHREIHEDLNVVENWNSANKDIFYGKAGELTGDDKEHVKVSALALHLVQAAIAYLNTIMIQIVLADPKWRKKLTDED